MDTGAFALAVPKDPAASQSQQDEAAVLQAWERHVSKLKPMEKSKFEGYRKGDLSSYVTAINQACKDQRKQSRSFRVAEWFEPLFKALNMYTPAATAAIQAYPNPGSIVLGAVVCVMQISDNFLSYQERIAAMLSRMGRKTQKLLQYEDNLYRNEPAVQKALVEIYGDMLDFCRTSLKLFVNEKGKVKSGLKTLSLSLWRPFETDLGAIVDRFETDLEEVEDRASECDKQRLKESLTRQRETSTEFSTVALGMIEFLDRQQVNFNQDRRRVEKLERVTKRKQIIQWLPSTSFHKHYDAKCEAHLANTGSWLIDNDQYLDWKAQEKSELLWVKGKSGCGKSILAALAISDLEVAKEPGIAIAYVFCMNGEATARDPLILACSLLRQLCQQYTSIDGTLETFFDDTADLQSEGPTWQQVTRALASIVSKFVQVFLIVDGLDECDEQNKFATLLHALVERSSSMAKVKLIIFSRPEYPSLEDAFTGCGQIRVDYGGYNFEDIKTYIVSKFAEKSEATSADQETLKFIRETCFEKADGMFLWVDLLEQSLKTAKTANQKKAKIKQVPKGLNNMYERSVMKIWNQEDDDNKKMAIDALIWTTNAVRPLKETEMLEAIAIKPGVTFLDEGDKLPDAASLISLCSDLIILNNEGCFTLVHASLKDYLTNIALDAPNPLAEYRLLQLDAQRRLAELCLTYLQFKVVQEGPTATRSALKELLEKHPFLQYAAGYWGRHATGDAEEKLQESIKKFAEVPNRRELSMQFILCFEDDDFWNHKGKSTPLHILSMFGLRATANSIPDVQRLKQVEDGAGYLPFHYALMEQHREMCLWLLEWTSNTDASEPRSWSQDTSLHYAAQLDWEDVVDQLLPLNGVDVNLRSGLTQATPLHRAVAGGSLSALQRLLQAGADPNLTDSDGDTPLNMAALKDQYEIAEALLLHKADPNICDSEGVTPLHYSAQEGNVELTKLLLQYSANPTAPAKGCANQTPLHIAAEKDSHEVIRVLYKEYDNIEIKCDGGYTPLHIAAFHNSTESARLLVSLGASVNTCDDVDSIPLHRAVQNDRLEILKALIELRSNISASATGENDWTPLQWAALEGHTKIASYLLGCMSPAEAKVAVNLKDKSGQTALHRSICEEVKPELVELFLSHGADPNITGVMDSPALHYAAHYGHSELIGMLVESKAEIEAKNEEGDTALHFCVRRGHLEFTQGLFEARPDLQANSVNNEKKTSLHIAASRGHADISALLLANGATSTKDDDNNLPLHLAAWNGSTKIVQQLVSADNVNVKGFTGRTALFGAAFDGNLNTARVLLEKGAIIQQADDLGTFPALVAAEKRNSSMVNLLLDEGADVVCLDRDDRCLLSVVAGNGDVQLVRRLLDAKCDGLRTDFWGDTPFSRAVSSNNIEIIDIFLEKQFNGCKIRSVIEGLPFHVAADQGNLDMMKKLLAHGAEINTHDCAMRTPMYLAASKGHYEVVDFLQLNSDGLCFDAPTIDNMTPLMAAASGRYPVFVKEMLELGANVNQISTTWGWTSILQAALTKSPQIVEMLLEAGADPYHRNSLGFNALDYASRHLPTLEAMTRKGFHHTPTDKQSHQKSLLDTVVTCIKALLSYSDLLSMGEQLLRVSYIRLIGYSLLLLEDDQDNKDAIPFLNEAYGDIPKAQWAWFFVCEVCQKTRWTSDKYHCLTCYDMTLCGGCHSRYVTGGTAPRSAPESFLALQKLEKECQSVRVIAQSYPDILYVSCALSTFVLTTNWIDEKNKQYEEWEKEHNSDGIYKDYKRPGQEFIKIVTETFEVLGAETKLGDADKMREKYAKFDREHKGDLVIEDFVCSGHEFLLLSEEDRKAAQKEGKTIDNDGKVTKSFLQSLTTKYCVESSEKSKSEKDKILVETAKSDQRKKADSMTKTSTLTLQRSELTKRSPSDSNPLSKPLGRAMTSPVLGQSTSTNPFYARPAISSVVTPGQQKAPETKPSTNESRGLDDRHIFLFPPGFQAPRRSFTLPARNVSTTKSAINLDPKGETNLSKLSNVLEQMTLNDLSLQPDAETLKKGLPTEDSGATSKKVFLFEPASAEDAEAEIEADTGQYRNVKGRTLVVDLDFEEDSDGDDDDEKPKLQILSAPAVIKLMLNSSLYELSVLVLAIKLAEAIRPGFAAIYVKAQLEKMREVVQEPLGEVGAAEE